MSFDVPQQPQNNGPSSAPELKVLGERIRTSLVSAAVSLELYEVATYLSRFDFAKEIITGVVVEFGIPVPQLNESNRDFFRSFIRVVADRLLPPLSQEKRVACIDVMLGVFSDKPLPKQLLPYAEIEACKNSIEIFIENGGLAIPNSRLRKDCIELSEKTGLLWLPHSLQRPDSLIAPDSPGVIVTCRCLVKSEEAVGFLLRELKSIATGLDGIEPIVCREECVDGGCYSVHLPASNGLLIDELPGVKERLKDEFSRRPLVAEYARDLPPEDAASLASRELLTTLEPSQADRMKNIATALSRSISGELIPSAVSELEDNQRRILLYFSSERVAQTIAETLNQFDLRPAPPELTTRAGAIASTAEGQIALLNLVGSEDELLHLAQVLHFDAAEKESRSLSAILIRLSKVNHLISQNDPVSDLRRSVANFQQAQQDSEGKQFLSFSSHIEANDLGNFLAKEIALVFFREIPTLGSSEVIEKLLNPQSLLEMVKKSSVVSLAQNPRARAQFAREIMETVNKKLNHEKIEGLSLTKANHILMELHRKRLPAIFSEHITNYHARLGLPPPSFLVS